MAFVTIDQTTPAGTDKKKFGDDIIRELKGQVADNLTEVTNYPASTKPALKTAVWTTDTRPAGDELVDRVTGYNTTLGYEEYYNLATTTWVNKNTSSLTAFLLTIYPVGSIYLSTASTSPATLFGGTWAQIQNTFLLAAGTSYTAGATGGATTHTLTVDEMPNHNHAPLYVGGSGQEDADPGSLIHTDYQESNGIQTNTAGYTGYTGGGAAHNNMPPYLAVYMWKRTA